MENFIVSARKYRPATFDTVVGQHAVTTTLKNAIKNNHLAQAFLFCGPRGVGKTTCARILAKTINCENRTGNIEACDQCEPCVSFRNGQSLNVYELDAASNNSVDDIRSLIDQVRIAPQVGSRKVYIIDEVHMLSTAAFNAFLKTLEEPPRHAIFILATTEKHKIIPTSLSRCQIFDFHRIRIDDMVAHLSSIASKENIEAEQDGLHIIAQKADGGLRDALSMFDQIVSFAGGKLTYKAVIENLNILDYDYYFKVTDAVVRNDIATTLLTFNDILSKGFDGNNFINGLASHLRNLLVCKDQATVKLLEVGKNIMEKYLSQASQCSVPFLLNGLNVLNKADLSYKGSKNQRLLVELALMQLCSSMPQTEEKKSQVIELKTAPAAAAPSAAASTPAPSPSAVTPAAATPSAAPAGPSAPAASYNSPRPQAVPVQNHMPPPTGSNPFREGVKFKTGTAITSNPFKPNVQEPEEKKNFEPLTNGSLQDPFTAPQLQAKLRQYAAIAKEQGKMNFAATITAGTPVIQDDWTVELPIENEVQREEIKIEVTDLLGYLKRELRNNDIKISVSLQEKPTEKRLYTDRDKFQRLAELNPSMNSFKQKLDLDINF